MQAIIISIMFVPMFSKSAPYFYKSIIILLFNSVFTFSRIVERKLYDELKNVQFFADISGLKSSE